MWDHDRVEEEQAGPEAREPRGAVAGLAVDHVCLRYPPAIGGVERAVEALVTNLAQVPGVRVRVLTTDHGVGAGPGLATGDLGTAAVPVLRHRCWTGRSSGRYPVVPALVQTLATSDAGMVHAHGQHLFTTDVAQVVQRLRGRPIVVSPYYHPPRTGLGHLHRATLGQLLRTADVVTVVSRFELAVLRREGLAPQRVRIVPPTLRALPAPDEAIWERLGVDPTQEAVVLSVGRAAAHKGMGLLTEAVGELRHQLPEVRVVVAGPGHGPERYREASFVVAGPVSDAELAALYAGARVAVLASSYEAFGLVVLESLRAGTPMVVPDTGAPAELLEGCSALRFRSGDASDLARCVSRLLRDEALVLSVVDWAKEEVLPRFTRTAQLDAVLDAYDVALTRRRRVTGVSEAVGRAQ